MREKIKRKSLDKFESNKEYHGCTFYQKESPYIKDLKNTLFSNCSFRTDVWFGDIINCEFNNCNFSGEICVDISQHKFTCIPGEICRLNPTILYANDNDIKHIQDSIDQFTRLKYLDMSNNPIRQVSKNVSKLRSLTELNLSGCPITWASCLNRIYSIPNLVNLNLNNCNLGYYSHDPVPGNLSLLKNIERLEMNTNMITHIPESIKGCKNLKVFSISDNDIRDLPKEISGLKELYNLRVSDNNLEDVPDEIINMPNLRMLSFYNAEMSTQSRLDIISKINNRDAKTTKELLYY